MTVADPVRSTALARTRVELRGTVQGVGLRPHVFRLASELHLAGSVANCADAVVVEVEGAPACLASFERALVTGAPAAARIERIDVAALPVSGERGFTIAGSAAADAGVAPGLPDLALCDACRAEIFDPRARRYRYAFTSCTDCGPRDSIQLRAPWDRANTAMARFVPCGDCAREYATPGDRRFHHQANACPRCGPRLSLLDARGATHAQEDDALGGAVAALAGGAIVAVKGVGGFHLCVAADDEHAIARLRRTKQRPARPLAIMVAALEAARELCAVDAPAAAALGSRAGPIVLLPRRDPAAEPLPGVAPGLRHLGVMLPYAPLHALILADLRRPLVVTSGNRRDEPLCHENARALQDLAGIADWFLVHDRDILRPADDSVLRMARGAPLLLRRARGFAPAPIACGPLPSAIGAGGDLKNTVAWIGGGALRVGPHLGDLQSQCARERHAAEIERLRAAAPTAPIGFDPHPDYAATRAVEAVPAGRPVQHHLAHAAAARADAGVDAPVLALCWDGTGLGRDGTVWGGEFIAIDGRRCWRAAYLRPFPLAGGDRAAREPRRSAIGLLHARGMAGLDARVDLAPIASLDEPARRNLLRMLDRGVNVAMTSSVGRLFDAVSSLAGLCQVAAYEGEAAIRLEDAARDARPWPFALSPGAAGIVIDWAPLIDALLADLACGSAPAAMAGALHATLAAMAVAVADRVGIGDVLLCGGCFQNARLVEAVADALVGVGLRPHPPRRLPPNDGALSAGQALAAAYDLRWEDEADVPGRARAG
ncbi:MAG: carbamoyltransferase HypF [Gammaproteobacteria bacterium]